MQPSGLQRRAANVPEFVNHTPRSWEITAPRDPSSQSPRTAGACRGAGASSPSDMLLGPTGMTIGFGAGPLYTNASMGQTPSHHQREKARKASSTILREDSLHQQVELSDEPYVANEAELLPPLPPLSRVDSWSMHYDCTDQAPCIHDHLYADRMITQTSLLNLPKGNASRDLAFFLHTTGPTAPHRKPSKIEQQPRRAVSAPKNALRFLRLGSGRQRPITPVDWQDEGGLLSEGPQPECVEQKLSSTGKKYLALRPQIPTSTLEDNIIEEEPEPSILSPNILESRVSVLFHHDDGPSSDDLSDWLSALNKQQTDTEPSIAGVDDNRPATSYEEVGSRLARRCPTPIRPAASNPPTPVPESAVSVADSYASTFVAPTPKGSFDEDQTMTNRPYKHPRPQTPKISLPKEEFPVKHPSPEKDVEIKHPLPRRLGSHPVLLQRASSIASTLYGSRSFSVSPGPPPPRSPLRLRRDPRTIEGIISNHSAERKSTPKIAPSIKSASDFDSGIEPIRATVTTECTGPIKRPKSRNKDDNSPLCRAYPINRRDREGQMRTRKLRDRPAVNRTIDSVVHAPVQSTRQRLKKIRPQIQIPDFRPPPLRAPSAASQTSGASAASWRKVTQSTLTPTSPVPSRASEESGEDKTGYTPISPTASAEARAVQEGLPFKPETLVAEKVPLTKTKSPPRPTKLILKEGKTYAPRPRSASVSRAAMKRRSRASGPNSKDSSPRSKSPQRRSREEVDHTPPLPSPPPTRALPPTPPASGSEKTMKANSKARVVDYKKELPTVPASHDVSPIESTSSSSSKRMPHVATQRKTVSSQQGSSSRSANRAACRIDARLEALERQNALLSAALMAVLKTNGALNGPVPGISDGMSESSKSPMAWESRVARRSAATSHTASSSNGSALEMYMSTRRGSRQGY